MERTVVQTHTGSFGHIMQTFALSLLVSFIGTLAGAMFIPPSLVGLFIVVEVVMLISVFIIRFRGKTIGYPFLYVFTAVTGVAIYPIIANYGGLLGANLVSAAFLATAGIFGGLSLYAYRISVCSDDWINCDERGFAIYSDGVDNESGLVRIGNCYFQRLGSVRCIPIQRWGWRQRSANGCTKHLFELH
jgi:hypothetical protein